MKKEILVAGILGVIVIFVWLLISHAILPFRSRMILKTIPDDQEIHEALKQKIQEPGIYVSPYLPPEKQAAYPDYGNEPIFNIVYTGMTHKTVAGFLSMATLYVIIAPFIAALLLSRASERILSRYSRRVLFVALLGLLLALFSMFGGDSQPTNIMIFTAVNTLITWILAGFVIASRIRGRTD